jgi:YVTN family beta-propeller protein
MTVTLRTVLAALAALIAVAGLAASVPAHASPASTSGAAALSPTLYVVNEGGTVVPGTVTPINAATDVAGSPIKVGSVPFAIVITPNGTTAYVSDISRNFVTPISTATNKAGRRIRVGVGPFNLAVMPSGRTVYVSNDDSSTVTPISTRSNKAGKAIRVGLDPGPIAISPNSKTVYSVGLSRLSAISTAANKVTKSVRLGKGTHAIAISPNNRSVYATNGNSLLRISAATLRVTKSVAVGADWGMVLSPNGKMIYTFGCSGAAGTVTPIPTATLRPERTIRPGFCVGTEIFAPDSKALYLVDSPDGLTNGAVIPLRTATNTVGSPISVGEQPGPMAILPGSTGSAGGTLYVVNVGSGTVTPISTTTDEAGAPIVVGYLPTAIAIAG